MIITIANEHIMLTHDKVKYIVRFKKEIKYER
jgi:hypothetical protein